MHGYNRAGILIVMMRHLTAVTVPKTGVWQQPAGKGSATPRAAWRQKGPGDQTPAYCSETSSSNALDAAELQPQLLNTSWRDITVTCCRLSPVKVTSGAALCREMQNKSRLPSADATFSPPLSGYYSYNNSYI